ncbi:hypothetical protein ACOT81_42780 [Streptomyces sp. WI04-05B]|uniref:MmyB family transcriptional regulator n=1 Tax=Streptomyces TaxID=1883 RepID=UPI0029BFB990|nr:MULTISPECIES: hypothetical protein [unclassified Streptomyces]
MRTLHEDWRAAGRGCVSHLRTTAAAYPDDPRLTSLVGELSVRDKDFGRWWGNSRVASRGQGTKRFHHTLVGELVLDRDTFTCGSASDQELVVWTAEPGTPSYDGLRALAARASGRLGGPTADDRSTGPTV